MSEHSVRVNITTSKYISTFQHKYKNNIAYNQYSKWSCKYLTHSKALELYQRFLRSIAVLKENNIFNYTATYGWTFMEFLDRRGIFLVGETDGEA